MTHRGIGFAWISGDVGLQCEGQHPVHHNPPDAEPVNEYANWWEAFGGGPHGRARNRAGCRVPSRPSRGHLPYLEEPGAITQDLKAPLPPPSPSPSSRLLTPVSPECFGREGGREGEQQGLEGRRYRPLTSEKAVFSAASFVNLSIIFCYYYYYYCCRNLFLATHLVIYTNFVSLSIILLLLSSLLLPLL